MHWYHTWGAGRLHLTRLILHDIMILAEGGLVSLFPPVHSEEEVTMSGKVTEAGRCSHQCCYYSDCGGFRNQFGRCPAWTQDKPLKQTWEDKLFFRVASTDLYETGVQKEERGAWETDKSEMTYWEACEELDKLRALVRDKKIWDAGLRVTKGG